MTHIKDLIIAEMQRETELMEADRAAMTEALDQRRRRAGGSVVFSVRLDPAEVEALERRGRRLDVKPSVLARNLIRMGLGSPTSIALEDVVDRLDRAMADLRALSASRVRMAEE